MRIPFLITQKVKHSNNLALNKKYLIITLIFVNKPHSSVDRDGNISKSKNIEIGDIGLE